MSTKTEKLTILANSPHLAEELSSCSSILVFQVHLPSSNITLSPKMTTSSSPLTCRRVRIFRLALLLALTSRAQTPTRPIGSALAVFRVN